MNTIDTNLNQVIMKALKYIALCAVYSNTIIMHTLSVVDMYVYACIYVGDRYITRPVLKQSDGFKSG